MSDNPLLTDGHRVPFDRIESQHVVPGVRAALARAKSELAELVTDPGALDYQAVIGRLDDLVEGVGRVFGLVSHLNAVLNTADFRAAFNEIMPEYAAFISGLLTDQPLWRKVKQYAATPDAAALTGVRRRNLNKVVADFRRSGADLPEAERQRVDALHIELAKLATRFSENVLDSTNAFELIIVDEADLAGLPEGLRRRARADAAAKGIAGWRFTLQAPSYGPFMQYSERRELRRKLHEAFYAIAATGEHDNLPVLREILAKRRELARLLGFKDFADLQLDDRMMATGERAVAFERELARLTLPYYQRERAEILRFAEDELGLVEIEPWDIGFVLERLRRARFAFDDESLRPYFPLSSVQRGLFELIERLFGVSITAANDLPVWHKDVTTYELRHEDGTYLGPIYTDWYPRDTKRAGAWMNGIVTGGPSGGGFDPHVGVVAANVTPPDDASEPLLTHDEVGTLFHEYGHLLHHLLCRVEVRSRSSNNVPWDFIELPSLIMENWTWEREALDLFARHHQTGEPIPDELFARLKASRTFLQAYDQMRQISFGTVDLAFHIDYDPDSDEDPIEFAQRIMEPFALRPGLRQARRMLSFSHVFAGAYAAGYYSYKWSEVLEADAFSRFREEGIFNPATGRDFAAIILAKGDSEDASELFRAFMGRDPDLRALIDRNLGPAPG